MSEHQSPATAARTRYQGRAAVRHDAQGQRRRFTPVWLPGRETNWRVAGHVPGPHRPTMEGHSVMPQAVTNLMR
jgi:hypothetical protein